MSHIQVVNKRDGGIPARGGGGIYIGRGNQHTRGSPLGNPFKMKRESDRDRVVEQYDQWLTGEMQKESSAARHEILRIAQLVQTHRYPTIHLVCWCAPKRCHGDVVKRAVEQQVLLWCQETKQQTHKQEQREEDEKLQILQKGQNLQQILQKGQNLQEAGISQKSPKNSNKNTLLRPNEAAVENAMAVEETAGEGDCGSTTKTTAKRIRKVQKLLRQISELKTRARESLNKDQMDKLETEAVLKQELGSLLLAAGEDDERQHGSA